MSNIHPSAIIEEGAQVDSSVKVGPYCVIGKNVKIGKNCNLQSHVVIQGYTTIGNDVEIYPFASLGQNPPDLKFKGEITYLEIGNKNVIREYVTINPGTGAGGGITKVGDNNLIMPLAHIAHDCQIGNNCIFSNGASLSGHVIVNDNVIFGGMCGIHQFTKIGSYSMIGGGSIVVQDVIPFGLVMGNRAYLDGLNLMGLKRRDVPKKTINELRKAYRLIFAPEGTLKERLADVVETYSENESVLSIVEFIKNSKKGVCTPNGK
ncbi:MAG: acyl-ACP--UDP-N-acetylglucosamine O-acyltransferase [Proteobacteria bacterium]|nr:acyl-ACP--UDP-N-acetylglucosamine O-acyltransferase [Pseudomonadota bacterium]